jgi:peptidoglycan/xylan/chitin deacetylase (PgdA/CDA1 family)
MPINILYHDLTATGCDDASGFPGPEAARYKLTPDDFRQHLGRVATVVRQPPLITTAPAEIERGDQHVWMITFDDGGRSAITETAEQLERLGWRGWFFISTDFIGAPTFCSRDQIQELHQRGHVIGSHSCSHPERISDCSWDQLIDEWTRSCRTLSNIIKQPVTTASVPGGFYSRTVARAAAQAGIRVLFNSEPTTRVSYVDQTLILGRYNVYRGMSAADAASIIISPARRWRQSAFWNLKKVAKVFVGPVYKMVRQKLLQRAYAKADSGK